MSLRPLEAAVGLLRGDTDFTVRIAAGTSSGPIVLWHSVLGAEGSPVVADARLLGHDGPVMRTVFSEDDELTWLASASVDRSVRLWKRLLCEDGKGKLSYEQTAAFYGHTARVWDIALCPSHGGIDDDGKVLRAPKIVSVSEDRSLRVWDGGMGEGEVEIFRDHAGKNVWTVDVCPGHDGAVHLASGGDDGIVALRSFAISGLAERELMSLKIEDAKKSTGEGERGGRELFISPLARDVEPGGYDSFFPRQKIEGRAEESVQALAWLSDKELYVSTSYGRVLLGSGSGSAGWDWWEKVKYLGDSGEELVPFSPKAMTVVDSHAFVGTTDGFIVAFNRCTGPALTLTFAAFAKDNVPQFVSDVFCSKCPSASTLNPKASPVFDVFASCFNGSVYSWRVHFGDWKVTALAVYLQEKENLFGQVTAVTRLPSRGDDVLVGNRRGCLRLYRGRKSKQVASCRPHSDRISCIALASEPVQQKDGADEFSVLTTGFDGRIVQSHVRFRGDNTIDCASISKAASTRLEERMTTLVDIDTSFFRPVVTAFRAESLVLYCVSSISPLARVNVGGWRRAFALILDESSSGMLAFSRGGALRIVDLKPDRVFSLGTPFHGLRTHSLSVTATDILTGSEDTTIRVTSLLKEEYGQHWRTLQTLTAHTSSVNCVSSVLLPDNSAILLSGGGMDELITWTKPTPKHAWSLANVHTPRRIGGRTAQEWQPRHRIVSLDLQLLDGFVDPLALVGRSDGSVTLTGIRIQKTEVFCRNADAHGGAVISCRWNSTSCSRSSNRDCEAGLCVSGDSSGRVCLWRVDSSLSLIPLKCFDRTHSAGVNDIALSGKFIASAGDDEAVVVRAWESGEVSGEGGQFGAAVVGVGFVWGGAGFVAVGADQRVILGWTGGAVVEIARTAISDPAGLEILSERESFGRVQVAIFGMGVETVWIGDQAAR